MPASVALAAVRLVQAAKLHQRAITHEFDDTTVKFGSLWLNQFSAKCFERRKRPGLVGGHEAAVAHDVGSKDGGQPAFYTLFTHGPPLTGMRKD